MKRIIQLIAIIMVLAAGQTANARTGVTYSPAESTFSLETNDDAQQVKLCIYNDGLDGKPVKTVNMKRAESVNGGALWQVSVKEDLKGKFCVINDTHVRWPAIGAELDKIAEIAPACVIWNGDASNTEEKLENLVNIYLDHSLERKDYAAETPYLFCPGNHDSRGRANRHLEKVWMYRQPEERDVRDWDLGRNFAVRLGEMALVGMDTAEDKLDTNPRFAGLFKSAEYREAQTAWLRDALKRPEIASAPYLVAFCHIPLFDDDPSHNPGDVAPDDTDPRYTTDYAYWQRTCGNMWGPLLHEAGCQVLIVGHLHRYRYYAPGADRCWAQLVGGGRDMKEGPGFPTVIEGKVLGDRLRLTVHNIFAGKVQDVFEFMPR